MLTLRTFGANELVVAAVPQDVAGTPVPTESRLGRGKPLAALIYLACAPRRTATREELLTLLWSDADAEHGFRSLRQSVWQIRQAIGRDALSGSGRSLVLSPTIEIDRDSFLQAVALSQAQTAVEVYAGPFLPDFAFPGADEFERWADLERSRLQRMFATSAAVSIRELLDRGSIQAAQDLARRLRDTEPSRESHWRLLLETLIAGRDSVAARIEADALDAMLAASGVTPEPSTRLALRTAAGIQKVAEAKDAADESRQLRAELIGREREFATIVTAWRQVRSRSLQHIHVVSMAGIGKTRLLEDVTARLRAQGACVVSVQPHNTERSISYSVAADIATALRDAPGAAGVSKHAMQILADFTSGSRTIDGGGGSDELLRARIGAIVETLEAITDEQPVAIIVDDLHWADHVSLTLLFAVLNRCRKCRLLAVTAARRIAQASHGIDVSRVVSLSPLSQVEVRAFVASIGALPAEPWVDNFVEALHRATRGSPLLAIEALRFLLERAILRCTDGEWACEDTGALEAFLVEGNAIHLRLRELPTAEVDVLRYLAVVGVPVPLEMLSRIIGKPDSGEVLADLQSLDRRGFARSGQAGWSVAHDEIADVSISMLDLECASSVHKGIAAALLEGDVTSATLQRAALHLSAAADRRGMEDVFRRWVLLHREQGSRESTRVLAERLYQVTDPGVIDDLITSLPLRARVSGKSTRVRTAIGVAAVLVATGCAFLLQTDRKPSSLTVVDGPMVMASWVPIVPTPVIELRDRNGRRVLSATDSIHVGIRGVHGHLRGTATVAAVNGRATFPDLIYEGRSDSMPELVFSARGLPSVTLTLPSVDKSDSRSDLHFVDAQLNGQTLSSRYRTLHVAPDDSISGSVTFRYTSAWPAATIMLGMVPGWGDRRTSWRSIGPMVTPARAAVRTNPIALQAPHDPGTYRLTFVFGAEDGIQYVASGTNWEVGRPVWGDGNDVADWTQAQLAEANRIGRVRSVLLAVHSQRVPDYVPATYVTVVVDGQTRSGK